MSVRIFLINLSALIVGATLLLACSGGDAPNPIFGSENLPPTDTAGTPEADTSPIVESPSASATPQEPPTSTPTGTAAPTATSTATGTATSTTTDTELPFNVTGRVCFPASRIPPMTAYFENTGDESVIELLIAENQDRYEIKLPAGTYIAYAWLEDYSQGGLYSRAVPCGLNEDCDDHGVQPFTVQPGEVLEGIDLCDWYAGPFNVPYPPGVDIGDLTGSLTGRLSYRDNTPVELRVVAFNADTGYWYWVSAEAGQAFYGIHNLPPGTYHVVAYDPQGRAGGHANARHELIDVVVEAGKLSEGADITDWDAPEGTFPPDPTR